MTDVREYFEGSTFVVEWVMVDPDGQPITGATVTGTIKLPSGGTTGMTVTPIGNTYRATYTAAAPGTHGWELAATGTGVDDRQGTFVVRRDLLGLPPITVDPTTDIGRVRLLATDLDEVEPLFDDAQITAFLTMEDAVVKRAAALALETIARSEALVSKKIRTQDLATDGPAVAKELRESAQGLRDQVDTTDDAFGLEIVDFDPYAAYRTAL